MSEQETLSNRPDDLYAELIALVAGLDDRQALKKLFQAILLLSNEIGDARLISRVLRDAFADE